MPSLLESTQKCLGGESLPPTHCDSRSLRLTRYARPELNDKTRPSRKAYLAAVTTAARESRAAEAARDWQCTLPGARTIHARLEARLLLHMAGSVLENAGLGLDRYGSVPIPGAAVKGCARRAALATLRQWSETNTQPTGDDLLALAAKPFADRADLLLAILRVFGCTDLEWEDFDAEKGEGNDLAWACGADLEGGKDKWEKLSAQARATLNEETGTPDEKAPTRRGAVAFLPAYPAKTPKDDLELDVLTPHHKAYYEGKPSHPVALDTEDPVPVFFPAVAAGAEYAFTVAPLGTAGRAAPEALDHAAIWLLTGLTTFGLGGKTGAGYGWFKDISAEVIERERKETENRQKAEREEADRKRQAKEEDARRDRKAGLAAMSPERRADAELAEKATNWGWMKMHLTNFAKHEKKDKEAILRWLLGAGRARWLEEIKPEAIKGKKPWSQIIGPVNKASKDSNITLP